MLPKDLVGKVSPKVAACLDYAGTLLGVTEDPLGSNRSPDIDDWCREFGSPLGSYWCALFVGHVRKKAGLWVPARAVGSCDQWVKEAKKAGHWSKEPVPGAAVLYTNWKKLPDGSEYDAVHIGLVLRVLPRLESVEANTTLAGFSRNGDTVAKKGIDPKKVLGYIHPGD